MSVLALMSCEKEDILKTDIETIDFNVKASSIKVIETKSDLINGTLPAGSSFGVLGYCVPYVSNTTTANFSGASGLWSVKQFNSHPDVFYKQKVDFDGSNCTYDVNTSLSGNQVAGWYDKNTEGIGNNEPSNFTYTFFAYYPYSKTNNGGWDVYPTSANGASSIKAPVLTFTMPDLGSSSSLDDTRIPDAMYASTFDRLRADGAVPLNFAHMLTGINVKVANYSDNAITINSVTLSGNFNKKATINFENGGLSYADTYNGTFNFYNGSYSLSSNATVNLNNGKTVLLISNANSDGNGLGNNIKLNVSYNGNSSKSFDIIANNFRPVAGTNYTLTLNFVKDAIILLTEAESQWEDGGDSNSTIK